MKLFLKYLFLAFMLIVGTTLTAQTLPSGYIGRVLNNTPGTWQAYSFSFTPSSTGSNYVMLAFRQDPAYWRVDNIRLTSPSSTTNLLTNGDMVTGGGITVQTNSGSQYINAPTAWGVGYQNGTYPAAAGTWTGGLWYDGAVGSFDSIYQAVNLTAGITYTLTFDVNGDGTSNGSSIQLGAYAGACSNLSMAPAECSLPSGSGFTQIATPSQTYTAGCTSNCPANPSSPTVVSTSTSNQTSSSTSTTSTNTISVTRPTTTGNYTDSYAGTATTVITTTTPVTTTTYSDGTTTTSNGTSSTTSSTTYAITPTLSQAPAYSRVAPNTGGNSVYVKQVYAWSNTNVTLEQEGNNNAITGTDSGWATVDGNNSSITVKQFGTGNIVGLKMNAWGNNINIKQNTASNGDVSNNIFNLESFGNGNALTLQQQTNSNAASVKLTYDINTVNLTQKGGINNTSYVTVAGYWNTVNNTQNGADNFSLVNIAGDNNSATVNQTGTGHSSLLNLIGNKNTVGVTQTGIGDVYSLQQTCTNPAGCSVSVIRNR
jgi:hypothetical protein